MQFLEAALETKQIRNSEFGLIKKQLIDNVLISDALIWMKFDKSRAQLKERNTSKIGKIPKGQFREITKYLFD